MHACAFVCVFVCVRMCVRAYVFIYARVCVTACVRACVCVCVRACVNVYVHIQCIWMYILNNNILNIQLLNILTEWHGLFSDNLNAPSGLHTLLL